MRLLVLATTTLAANVRWPPQLNEQDAGVVVRGRAVSVVSQRGCFSVDGRPCAAAVPHAGDDDDQALSPPAAVAAAAPLTQAVDADLLVVAMVLCAIYEGILRQDIPRPRTETRALDARRRDGRPDRALRERGVRWPAREEAILRKITHY